MSFNQEIDFDFLQSGFRNEYFSWMELNNVQVDSLNALISTLVVLFRAQNMNTSCLPVVALAYSKVDTLPINIEIIEQGIRETGADVWFMGEQSLAEFEYHQAERNTDAGVHIRFHKQKHGLDLTSFSQGTRVTGSMLHKALSFVRKPLSQKFPTGDLLEEFDRTPYFENLGSAAQHLKPYRIIIGYTPSTVSDTWKNILVKTSLRPVLTQLGSLADKTMHRSICEEIAELGFYIDPQSEVLSIWNNNGLQLRSDQIAAALGYALYLIGRQETVVLDFRMPKQLFMFLSAQKHRVLIVDCLETHFREKLGRSQAAFGAMADGRIFFQSTHGYNADPFHAALKILDIASQSEQSPSRLVENYIDNLSFLKYRFHIKNAPLKYVLQELQKNFLAQNYRVEEHSGIRCETDLGDIAYQIEDTRVHLLAWIWATPLNLNVLKTICIDSLRSALVSFPEAEIYLQMENEEITNVEI